MPVMKTIKQASQETGLSYNCLRQLCINNQIVHIRVGSKFMINMDRLKDFLNGETKDATGMDKDS